MEDIYDGLTEPRGRPLSTTVYFDSNHAHDQVNRRSVSVGLSFVGSTPISWTSKSKGTIESYSYSSGLCAGRVASEEAIALRNMLRSLSVPVKGTTALCGDNLGMIISCTNPELELKKKHVAISYHKLRECTAAGIFNPIKIYTMVNQAEVFTKCVLVGTLGSLSDASYVVEWG